MTRLLLLGLLLLRMRMRMRMLLIMLISLAPGVRVEAAGAEHVVGEDGRGERGGVEEVGAERVEVVGGAGGGFRDGAGVARGGAAAFEGPLDFGFDRVQAEILPAVLDLDVGEREAVLQREGHLGRRLAW